MANLAHDRDHINEARPDPVGSPADAWGAEDRGRRCPDSANDLVSAGAALLARLKAIGVDYIFTNSGTDFPPIIEGLSNAQSQDLALPEALLITHEHAAVGMAHGYYLATGRAQAAMLHTNVGLANAATGAINAASDRIPMILMSGRTPATEQGRFGSRSFPIGWGQEMRDQTALVREACKWDYELRFSEQVPEMIDRAYAIAMSSPKGPVYISLPREVLSESTLRSSLTQPPTMRPSLTAPAAADINHVAQLLANAKHPVIFAQQGAGNQQGFEALSRLADTWSIPVCQYWAVATAVPTDHPCYIGSSPEPWLGEADVVLVIDSLAPWEPGRHGPYSGATVIQMGPDPLFQRVPIRNFRSDITIACDTSTGIQMLESAMRPIEGNADSLRRRRTTIEDYVAAARAGRKQRATVAETMNKDYVGQCLSEAIADYDPIVLSELGCPLDQMVLRRHDSWRQEPHSGGLGWSFPCGLGMQLADRDRLVVATMGDGSYIFSNPVACHQIAEALALPILVLVLNNGGYGAVEQSVIGHYPEGSAAAANRVPLTRIEPTPDFTKIAAASRGYAERVERPADLPGALATAIDHVRERREQALLEIIIA